MILIGSCSLLPEGLRWSFPASARGPLYRMSLSLGENPFLPCGSRAFLCVSQVRLWIWLLAGFGCTFCSQATEGAVAQLPPPVSRPVDFVKEVQPIFAEHCYDCHGPDKQEAQFRLDVKEI